MPIPPRRGEVYSVDFSPTRGSEQAGERPALVVSNDVGNEFGSVVTVVAITHTIPRRQYPQNVSLPPDLLDQQGGTIYCGQLLTVAKERLGNLINTLPTAVMDQVDEALALHLSLRIP